MLIAHLADIHIGHRQYGLEQRAEDYAQAFRRAVEKILELKREKGLDIVVISGDLFDTTRPSPNSYVVVIDCLRRLIESGIRVYATRGNHEASVINPVDNPLNVLASMRLIKYLERDYVDISKIRIIGHGCVYTDFQNKLYSALSNMVDSDKLNIVLLHQYIEGTPYIYPMPNLDHYTVSKKVVEALAKDYDVLFLCGHIHEHNLRHPELPVYYAGSLEIWDSREFETYEMRDGKLVRVREQAQKGFLLVEVYESSGKFRITPVTLPTSRRMIKIELVYDEVDPIVFKRDMTYLIENFDVPDAYIQIEVRGKLRRGYASRDLQAANFRRMFRKALRVDIRLDLSREEDIRRSKTGTTTQTGIMYGIDAIIRRAVREVLGKDPDAEKIEELVVQLVDKIEQGDKMGVIMLLEKYLGLSIRQDMDITALLSGK